jgi:biotin-dependent carboxylase-like uncharacterized protein
MIEVVAAGPLTTVQDLGRPGLAHLGVGTSGAADQDSLRLANRLVGNPQGAACLEMTFGGFRARFSAAATIALTGAPCPLRLAGVAVDMTAPVPVGAGEELVIGTPTGGLRTYLAVRGGLAVPPVLGSRSTDVLAGLGPPIVTAGTRLPVGVPPRRLPPGVSVAPVPGLAAEPVLTVTLGPRTDWFRADAPAALCSAPYEVSPESNRVGIRLTGPLLERAIDAELPSEGMVTGALQVPPNGQPVLFLADHPVTGGYPVIGVVADADVALAAQARPGQRVRFRLAS